MTLRFCIGAAAILASGCLAASSYAATYSGTGGPIPDGASLTGPPGVIASDVTVSDSLAIQGLTVTVNGLVHTWCGDVIITLTHVNTGATCTLVSRIGLPANPGPIDFGDSSNYNGNYGFADTFTANIWTAAAAGGTTYIIPPGGYVATAPVTGYPVSILGVFGGTDSAGTWRLTISDAVAGDKGSFTGWTLEIAGVPFDLDTDGDGTPDLSDGCPNDPNKIAPGMCGCGVPDTDSDRDGTPDCNDGCPNDPNKIAPGACGCGVADVDSDGDGVPNCEDNCPEGSEQGRARTCGCGVADTDSDRDGTPDCNDGCPNDPNKIALARAAVAFSTLTATAMELPTATMKPPERSQQDALPGTCGCGADTDSDRDGTPDCSDGCPNDPKKIEPGTCGCGVPDADSDRDGTPDRNDGCPNDPNKIAPRTCAVACRTPTATVTELPTATMAARTIRSRCPRLARAVAA
ncbi:MAG: thrombospondin type 3 repeat-containing protein [Phycisphaerales bacterium]